MLEELKSLDESGAHLGLTRPYGRAAPGDQVVESTPGHSGPHYTIVAALSLTGISAPGVFEGAVTSLRFRAHLDLNPIELCWVTIKKAWRTTKARSFDALADGWLAHCGYFPV